MAGQAVLFKKRQEDHMLLLLRDFEQGAQSDIDMLNTAWPSIVKELEPVNHQSVEQEYAKLITHYREERTKFIDMFKYNYEKVDKYYSELLEKNINNPLFDMKSLPEFINYWETERHQVVSEYQDRRSIELQEMMDWLLKKNPNFVAIPKKKRESIIKAFSRLDDEMRWLKHY